MQLWVKLSILTSIFGFLKELQPSEPFLMNFFMEFRNVTMAEAEQLFPIETYTYAVALFLVLLIADYLLYKPLIIMVGVTGSLVYILFLFTTQFWGLQLGEAMYGIYVAVDIAYLPYIYAKVDPEYYSIVTGHLHSGEFIGNFIGSGLGQLFVVYNWVSYRDLNIHSLVFQVACMLWAFLLPNVERPPNPENNEETGCCKTFTSTITDTAKSLYTNFISAYSNPELVPWCIWFSFAWSCNVLLLIYRQLMWKEIVRHPNITWNGAVEAFSKLFCAIFSFLTGYVYSVKSVERQGLYILSVITIICGFFILLMCLSKIIWYSFAGYMLFNTFLSVNLTIANTEVAKKLSDNSFGLIFGVNTLIAILIQCVITGIFVNAMRKNPLPLFVIFAIWFFALGIGFLIFSIVKSCTTEKTTE